MELLRVPAYVTVLMLALLARPTSAEPEPVIASGPRVYALVSAIGDRITYTQNRIDAGSRIEPYRRSTLELGDHALNATVLKGLNDTIAQRQPASRRVLLALEPREAHGVDPTEREQRAIDAVLATLQPMPERSGWDEIIVVTPAYIHGRVEGLGPRLHGAGIYVHPVLSDKLIEEKTHRVIDPDSVGGPREFVVSPKGRDHMSRQFFAVHFYASIWRFDARTLKLISKVQRFDSVKYNDPDSGAVHYAQSVAPEFLAQRMASMIETSTAAGLRATMGVVEVGPLEIVGDGEAPNRPSDPGAQSPQ